MPSLSDNRGVCVSFMLHYVMQVCKKTLEPMWEHELFINTGTENQIKMEIFDKDKIGKVCFENSLLRMV